MTTLVARGLEIKVIFYFVAVFLVKHIADLNITRFLNQ